MFKFLVNIVGVIVLSYFVSPAEVGIVTVAWAIVSAGEILRDFGLSAAVIRAADVTTGERNNLFWLNTGIGIALAAILVCVSPTIAFGFDIPALTAVLMALSSVFVLNGLSSQYRADLNRRRKFSRLAMVDLIAPAVGLASAIPAAIMGLGYWAIAVQYIVAAVTTLVVVGVLAAWWPGLPSRHHSVRKYLGFGYRVALSQGMSYLGNNVDTLALGAWSVPAEVGYYGRGYQLSVSPLTQLRTPATSIAVPSLARHEPGTEALTRLLMHGQLLVGWMSLPIATIMAVAHEPIIAIALGDEWAPTAPIFAILAMAGGLQSLSAVANWAFLTVGDGRSLRNYSAIALLTKTVLVVSVAWLGASAVAIAFLASVVFLWPVAVVWSMRVASVRPAPVLLQGLRLLAINVVAGFVAYAIISIVDLSGWSAIGTVLGSTILIYAAGASLRPYRRDYMVLWHEARALARPSRGRQG